MSELKEAIALANGILERRNDDVLKPHTDLHILSRQLLRQVETVQRLKNDLAAMHDPTADLIQANRDEILRKHEEAVRRVRWCLERGLADDGVTMGDDGVAMFVLERDCKLAIAVLDALGMFHPMHGEDFSWPEIG